MPGGGGMGRRAAQAGRTRRGRDRLAGRTREGTARRGRGRHGGTRRSRVVRGGLAGHGGPVRRRRARRRDGRRLTELGSGAAAHDAVDLGHRRGRGLRDGLGGRLHDGSTSRHRGGLHRLGRRLRDGLGGGLGLADQTLALGLAPDTVCLRVLDRRRVALHADAERQGEVERLLVGEAELSRSS